MTTFKVGYLIGSLAKESINRQLATALVRVAPEHLTFTEIPIKDLPLYSYDYDADYPPVAQDVQGGHRGASMRCCSSRPSTTARFPGALKNAIDWASRPYGKNSFTRKPSAVIGTSPGAIGTAVAQQHLRSVLGFCNSPQMNAPEAYIQFTPGLITDDGEVTNESTAEFLRNYMAEFHQFIVQGLHRPAAGCLTPSGGMSRGPALDEIRRRSCSPLGTPEESQISGQGFGGEVNEPAFGPATPLQPGGGKGQVSNDGFRLCRNASHPLKDGIDGADDARRQVLLASQSLQVKHGQPKRIHGKAPLLHVGTPSPAFSDQRTSLRRRW